jgi:hypothetical protein
MDEVLTPEEFESLPANKQVLMERIRKSHDALEQLIQPLSDSQLSQAGTGGGWAVKDHLAHLAAWEQFMLKHYLQRLPSHEAMGIDAETMKDLDEDGINDVIYHRIKDRTAGQVLADYRRSYAQVLETLEAISYEALMEALVPGGAEPRPRILWVIGNTYQHYLEHRQWIGEMLARDAS